MGYNLFSFGIKTANIKDIFGSQDKAVLENVKLSDTFKHYSKNDFSGISVGTALRQIVNGDSLSQEAGYQYGYAIICICATLGSEMPYMQEINLGYETDFINKYLSESFGVQNVVIEEALLADNTNPFEIPIIEDWPMIGFLDQEGLIQLKEKLGNINITSDQIDELENGINDDDEEKSFAYRHIQGIIENINYCMQNDLELITFCH